MPCSPSDLSVNIPDGPTGPSIPGFGIPFAIQTPDLSGFLGGFPEDLLALLDKLQLLIPVGQFKPQLSINFGKDIFDAIMKLLDQFMPFLMLYKFFLPILKLIICIIEVLCAIPNPFKLVRAIIRLFRDCLPPFLNLFPILALIIMIISLILLLIALIEYIILEIIKFILLIIKNIKMLVEAFQQGDAKGILLILKKIGAVLCIFQNLFVLLALFTMIVQVIKDILGLAFALPPCDDGDTSDDGCCTPDVCPAIIKNGNYTRTTGTLQYFNSVQAQNTIPGLPPGLPPEFSFLTIPFRSETWQLFDPNQSTAERFINIVDGYDVPPQPPFFVTKPNFFPTDAVYSQNTSPKQAAYTVDLRLFYNPANWGRNLPIDGYARYIQFKDCIVLSQPTTFYGNYNSLPVPMPTGSFTLAGGTGYEDDGKTPLKGYDIDGVTQIDNVASLNKFLHKADVNTSAPILLPTDGYQFSNVEYTFKPNISVLLGKNLITAGCIPSLSLNKAFINQALTGDIAIKLQLLTNLLNGPKFPDTNKAQECLATAISAFRSNVTLEGAAQMQTTMLLCLQKLKDDALSSLQDLIGIGFDPCKSDFTGEPKTQFTSKPIKISVNIKESNGVSLTSGIPLDIADALASRIKAYPTFGTVSKFAYDGYQAFTAELSSIDPGDGQVMVSFDNQIFCKNIIPADINILPTRELQQFDYKFIYTPVGLTIPVAPTPEGDTSDGVSPRRDDGEISISSNESKDGS